MAMERMSPWRIVSTRAIRPASMSSIRLLSRQWRLVGKLMMYRGSSSRSRSNTNMRMLRNRSVSPWPARPGLDARRARGGGERRDDVGVEQPASQRSTSRPTSRLRRVEIVQAQALEKRDQGHPRPGSDKAFVLLRVHTDEGGAATDRDRLRSLVARAGVWNALFTTGRGSVSHPPLPHAYRERLSWGSRCTCRPHPA
jgi:hypothetical protein